MGRPRLQLHQILKEITEFVYHQPPNNLQMKYPCIKYERDRADTEFADNLSYGYTQRYKITVIDEDPDSTIPAEIAALPQCLFDRHYAANDLNHDVFNLFF